MANWVSMIVTIMCSIIASSGLWTYLIKRGDKKDVRSQLLVGLAHDRIIYLGMQYIDRGWITKDEYENINDYLYLPYKKLGGNGSAKRIMEEIEKLPFRSPTHIIGGNNDAK